MASYISKRGICRPAKEKAVNIRTGEVYEGPDREALAFIKQETGSEDGFIGMDSRLDPENIMRARQLGMTIDEFLKLNDPVTPEQARAEAENENVVVTHIPKPSKPGVRTGSGGFGDIPNG